MSLIDRGFVRGLLIGYHITELQWYIRPFQSERLRCAIGVDFKALSRELRRGQISPSKNHHTIDLVSHLHDAVEALSYAETKTATLRITWFVSGGSTTAYFWEEILHLLVPSPAPAGNLLYPLPNPVNCEDGRPRRGIASSSKSCRHGK